MAINTETLYRRLYDNLSSKGYNPKSESALTGKEVVPEEADFIEFDFDKGEGTIPVTVSVDKRNDRYSLTLYYTDDVTENGTDEWYKLQKDIRYTAQLCGINSFVLRNRNHLKPDMQKREYMRKQEQIAEGYYPMGKKASYSDNVPAVKIILQHTRQIEEGEQRYRNIAKIFVENQNGERFLIPTTKPGLARVFARHISEGGTPYDDRGQHISSLVEEYSKMAGFVRATRGHQFNESALKLVESGINHYQSLRESLSRMTGRRGYNNYFESWTPPLMEDDSDTSNLNELFVQETLDPRIESVMPILSKLQKNISEMSEVVALEEWADSLLEAPGAETLAHNQSTEKQNLKAFGLAEGTRTGDPVYIEGCEWNDVVKWLVKNVGPLTKKNPNYAQGYEGRGWILYPTNRTDEEGLEVLELSADTKLANKQVLAKSIQMACSGQQGVAEGRLTNFDNLSDAELIRLAHRGYISGNLEYNHDGHLVNRDEIIRLLKATDDSAEENDDDFMEQGMAEGTIYDMGKEYGAPASPRRPLPSGGSMPRKHDDDPDFMDPDQRRLRADQARVKKAQDEYHAKKNQGMTESDTTVQPAVQIINDFDEVVDKFDTVPKGFRDALRSSEFDAVQWLADIMKNDPDFDITTIEKIVLQPGVYGPDEHVIDVTEYLDHLDEAIAEDSQINEMPDTQFHEGEFAGDFKTGPAGQWRNKGPKANKPATIGDLVGESESVDNNESAIAEGQDDLEAMLRIVKR